MGVPDAGWVVHTEVDLREIFCVGDLINENHLKTSSSVKEFQYWHLGKLGFRIPVAVWIKSDS